MWAFFKRHNVFLLAMIIMLFSIVTIYRVKWERKKPYLKYFVSETIIESKSCSGKPDGTYKVRSMVKVCPPSDAIIMAILGISEDCKTAKKLSSKCEKLKMGDFYLSRRGPILKDENERTH